MFVLELLQPKLHGGISKRMERCPIKLGPVRCHSDVTPHSSQLPTTAGGQADRQAGRRRLARIQADNKITILFSVLKLGNKLEFDKFVCVLVLNNITVTHNSSQAHVLYSKDKTNCGLLSTRTSVYDFVSYSAA
jgi:hypothetical protein